MRLTKRELAVMRVLWEANEPLTVSEIVERDADGTIDSVQRVVKNLLKKNAVAIEGYEQIGKKISRKLKPVIDSESIELPAFEEFINNLASKNISTCHIVAALLPTDDSPKALEELNALEELIKRKKAEIMAEESANDPTNDK